MVSATVSALCIASQTTWICEGNWRRRPDLNRGWRSCSPLPYLLATAPQNGSRAAKARAASVKRVERETGFEPANSTLARSHSTTELFPPEPSTYHHNRTE